MEKFDTDGKMSGNRTSRSVWTMRQACREREKYDAVIFDLDGTLLDTLDDLTASANAAAGVCQLPPFSRDEIRSFVGNGARRLIERMLPEDIRERYFDTALSTFREHYAVHCMDRTEPYPGVIALLDWLKKEGFCTAIVSNKPDFAVRKLAKIYFSDLVDYAAGERAGVEKKPAPDMVYAALEALQAPVHRALYVGDSDVDIRTAENAGMDVAAVTWGFRSREFLLQHGAVHLADNVSELRSLIAGR